MKKILTLTYLLVFTAICHGQKLTNYTKESTADYQNGILGLPSNTIYQVAVSPNGNVWLATANGISKFNPTTKTFTNYKSGTAYKSITIVKGGLVIAGGNGLISEFNGTGFTDYAVNSYPADITNITADSSSGITEVYISGTAGIAYDNGNHVFVDAQQVSGTTYSVPKNSMFDYYLNGTERHVWFATSTYKIVHLDVKAYTFTEYLIGYDIKGITRVDDNTIAVATSNGPYLLDMTTGNTTMLGFELNASDIKCVQADGSGNFWIGYANASSAKRITRRSSDGTYMYEIQLSMIFNHMTTNSNGDVYVATQNNGLVFFDHNATPEVTTVQSGNALTLSTIEVKGATYQWFYHASGSNFKVSALADGEITGATSYTYTATDAGWYKVRIVNGKDTTWSNPIEKLGTTTGIDNTTSATSLSVYPIPNQGEINFMSTENISEVILMDAYGKVEVHKIMNISSPINTELKGLVIIQLKTDKGSITRKLIIE